jgi:hypothetical protein
VAKLVLLHQAKVKEKKVKALASQAPHPVANYTNPYASDIYEPTIAPNHQAHVMFGTTTSNVVISTPDNASKAKSAHSFTIKIIPTRSPIHYTSKEKKDQGKTTAKESTLN